MSKVAKLLAQLPWIKRIPDSKEVPCDGIKWGKVAMRDIYWTNGKPPRGIQDRARCKNRARWRYRALKRARLWEHTASSGNYCTSHACSQFYSQPELRRFRQWEANHRDD